MAASPKPPSLMSNLYLITEYRSKYPWTCSSRGTTQHMCGTKVSLGKTTREDVDGYRSLRIQLDALSVPERHPVPLAKLGKSPYATRFRVCDPAFAHLYLKLPREFDRVLLTDYCIKNFPTETVRYRNRIYSRHMCFPCKIRSVFPNQHNLLQKYPHRSTFDIFVIATYSTP